MHVALWPLHIYARTWMSFSFFGLAKHNLLLSTTKSSRSELEASSDEENHNLISTCSYYLKVANLGGEVE